MTNNPSRARTGNCIDCRFWNRNGSPFERPSEEGDPEEFLEYNLPVPTRKQKCLRVLHANGCREGYGDPAIVTDGSGYAAAFWTEPTFGCTSFEPEDK